MILGKLAAVGAGTILFAGLSFAQITAMNGTVKGEDGKPLKGAVIKIVRTDIKGNYKTTTNKKGEYYYGGLPLGTYNVTCEVDGKDVDSLNGVRTGLGEPKTVDFDLQALKAKRDQLAKAAETGQLTAQQQKELTPEQRAQMDKQMKERQTQLAKNKALNDAFNAGMQAMQAKQWPDAIQAFQKAAELDANQHVVWAQLADCEIQLGKTKAGQEQQDLLNKGLESWQKALALAPNDSGYHNNYALALATAKKFQEAQAELEKAAQLDPPQAGKFFYNLGALYVNSGQLEPSGAAFKRALEADPNYAEANYQYGIYLMGKATTTAEGKIVPPEGTRQYFEKYLQLAPTGQNAESAKAMLAMMESKIETQYVNPEAKQKKKKK